MTWLGLDIGRLTFTVDSDEKVLRSVGPSDDLQNRQHDCEDDALLHPDPKEHDGSSHGDHEFAEPSQRFNRPTHQTC